MTSIITQEMWQHVVYAHELNVEDFGRNVLEEEDKFYTSKDTLLRGFKFFEKREGSSTGEEYLAQKRKMYQMRESIQSIRGRIFDIAMDLETQKRRR